MMHQQTALSKILSFFIVKIIIGIVVVVGLVAWVDSSGRSLLEDSPLDGQSKDIIIAISEAAIALFSYILLFRVYERRPVLELKLSTFGKNATAGFAVGLILQSLFIFVLYLAGDYSIINVNAPSFLLPSFSTALVAGFVAEILIRGIFFRLIEEKLGTTIGLIFLTLLFGVSHTKAIGATAFSILTTAVEAGLLLSAAYVMTRSLWASISLHFAWDFAEPGIFGAINPGNNISQSLLTSRISGSAFLTGGPMGPQNSVQALIFCSITAFLFLWHANQNKKFIKPYWRNNITTS